MSDEEKKALEIIKFLQYKCIEENGTGMMSIYRIDDLAKAIDTILNLIEKQQKEIEELKDKYSDEKIRNTVIKRYREVIEKDYVSRDKIKAKIEELEKEITEDKKKNDDFWSDYSIYLDAQREGFQSLLEKE